MSKRWDLLRAAGLGALVGALYSVYKAFAEHAASPIEYKGGLLIGGIVAGAVLFGLVAGILNLLVKAR